MSIAFFPFKYYSVLPDYSLTTKIREESWDLDKLFPILKRTKAELRELMKSMKTRDDVDKLEEAVELLAKEILAGFRFLKMISFYDSALLYLYYRLLRHVFELCENEKRRLEREEEKAEHDIKGLKEASDEMKSNIKGFKRKMKGLAIAEGELVRVDERLIRKLGRMKWKAEKRAQHEFSFDEWTLRSVENLNRKVKVEAMKVKKTIPEKVFLMRKVENDNINPKDVVSLAKLVSEAIKRISKDVDYSSKLLKDFQDEIDNLKKEVENLKKRLTTLSIGREKAQQVAKLWDDCIRHLEDEVHDILMEIFRDRFVEDKLVATRKLA